MKLRSTDDGLSAGAKACNRGADLAEQGRHADAIVALRKALRLDPGCAEALCNLATLLGDPKEAIELARRAVARAPDWPTAHYTLGSALVRGGFRFAALGSLRTFLRLADPIEHADIYGAAHRVAAQIRIEIVTERA